MKHLELAEGLGDDPHLLLQHDDVLLVLREVLKGAVVRAVPQLTDLAAHLIRLAHPVLHLIQPDTQ
eukprot:1193663-Prorocentrum_minimum.AAC.2